MKKEMRIISPGPLTTVQDFGRAGYQAKGFTVCGAADADSMMTANLLCGNAPGEGVLEMTLFGICAQFMCDTVIALSGADVSPVINGKPAEMNRAYYLHAGSYLLCNGSSNGVRAYLAVAGGFDIQPIMGSVATGLKFALGGWYGRKLAAGDVIPLKCKTARPSDIDERYVAREAYTDTVTLRCVPGPQDDMFTEKGIADFFGTPYTVTPASDRMGIRLEGTALESKNGTDIISDGIVSGSVQVPSNGQPILLIADHQTTGGYAKIATVISADIPKAGQLTAGNTVRFLPVTVEEAQDAARERKARFDALSAKFR